MDEVNARREVMSARFSSARNDGLRFYTQVVGEINSSSYWYNITITLHETRIDLYRFYQTWHVIQTVITWTKYRSR